MNTVAAAWRERATDVAEWLWTHLVCRTDVWGAYGPHGARTAPRLDERGQRLLTPALLARPYLGGRPLGLHTTSAEQTSRRAEFDLDCHDDDAATAEQLRENARRLVAAMRARGLSVLVIDSNGAGGLHLRAIFDAPVPTRDVHALLLAVLAEVGVAHETYPKQPHASAFGNWLRNPGPHHTRPHFSRVWDRGLWLQGGDAVAALLHAPLTPASVVPAAPAPTTMVRRVLPSVLFGPGPAAERRIAAYRAKLPTGLPAGAGRSDVAFNFARFLVHVCGLSDADALAELQTWNVGNATPLSSEKLADTIANVHRYNARPPAAGHIVADWTPFSRVQARRVG